METIARTQLVWVRFSTFGFGVGTPFPDQPLLNGCWITGIEAVDANEMEATPDGTPLATNLVPYALSLYDGSDVLHQDVPCTLLQPSLMAGIWKEFVPFVCDWQKSRVIWRGAAAPAEAEAVAFAVHYVLPDELNKGGLRTGLVL